MNKKLIICSLLLVSTMILAACAPSPRQQVVPLEQLGTAIVETSAALATQTALLLPPESLELTNAPLATQTLASTSTPAPTETTTSTPFVITVPTQTGTNTPTRTATATKTPTKTINQPCTIMAQMPANNTQFGGGAFFDTVWTLVNSGTATWSTGEVDITYIGGTKFHLDGDVLDLTANTGPGQSTAVIIHNQAPSTAGTYTETWSLKQGSLVYCTMSVTIVVK